MSIVYKVTNLVNGKVYIGQTSKTIGCRREDHISDAAYNLNKRLSGQPFHLALLAHGKSNFEWSTLRDNLSNEEANYWETHYIKEFDSYHTGYNATTGGKTHWEHTDETKQKIAEIASVLSKKMWEDSEHIVKMSEKTKQSWQDDEVRKTRSRAIKNIRSTPEQRELSSKDSSKRYENKNKRDEMAKACGAKAFDVFKDEEHVGTWVNAAQCAKDLNLATKSHISNCLHGRSKSYCGYIFKYSENTTFC